MVTDEEAGAPTTSGRAGRAYGGVTVEGRVGRSKKGSKPVVAAKGVLVSTCCDLSWDSRDLLVLM